MQIVVNHLTRMRPGFICVAGVRERPRAHIRPVLQTQLPRALLSAEGGPFGIGHRVELGTTTPQPEPPETEDHRFNVNAAVKVDALDPDGFWELLKGMSHETLTDIFGSELALRGKGATVDRGWGATSLGVWRPSHPPRLRVTNYGGKVKVRAAVTAEFGDLDLSVTDVRLFNEDYSRVSTRLVNDLNKRMAHSDVLLSVGLARAWHKPGDSAARHWLQVNNLHLADAPTWNVTD